MQPQRTEYKGHCIELRERGDGLELLIDSVPVRYGQLPDGQYFLRPYAYDPGDDLMDVSRRFIDYKDKVQQVRQERQSNKTKGN